MVEHLDNKVENTGAIGPLIKGDPRRYYDKYVAFSSFGDGKIVAYGKNPSKVIKKAREKGHKEPVIVYVPDPNIPQIYAVA